MVARRASTSSAVRPGLGWKTAVTTTGTGAPRARQRADGLILPPGSMAEQPVGRALGQRSGHVLEPAPDQRAVRVVAQRVDRALRQPEEGVGALRVAQPSVVVGKAQVQR